MGTKRMIDAILLIFSILFLDILSFYNNSLYQPHLLNMMKGCGDYGDLWEAVLTAIKILGLTFTDILSDD